MKKYQVGEVRPSQLLLTYGIGSIIDLPHMSALIMGLDDWESFRGVEIPEERLLRAVQSVLGSQVRQLLSPPANETAPMYGYLPGSLVGVPVAAFPRWMVCPACHLLAPLETGFFELKANAFQPDKTAYRHINCDKARQPIVLPSRFMIACDAGHLDDFPWIHFVHGDKHCKAHLYMYERGVTGEPSDISIECKACGEKRAMSEAFSSEEDKVYRPACRGRRPHLRDFEKKACEYHARTILLAASNTWFPLVFSSLSLPTATNDLEQQVETFWSMLGEAESQEEVAVLRKLPQLKDALSSYSNEAIWQMIERKRTVADEPVKPGELKLPEWQMLINPHTAPQTDDFVVTPADLPEGYRKIIQQVVLVEKLREVRALTGFTRLESLSDYTEEEHLPKEHIMPLSRRAPHWLPASEVRGEGIFLQFREDALQDWLQQPALRRHNTMFHEAHTRWRAARKIESPDANYPGLRYVLLHTFAHALIRQLTLECGYTAASIRERIYAQEPESQGGAMAGILLYTSASDSEGTLGGLVNQGKALGYHFDGALEQMERCASDPLCAEHTCNEDQTLHAAACHACMFIPETSCERGNKYLDRSVLVRTVERDDLTFFPELSKLSELS